MLNKYLSNLHNSQYLRPLLNVSTTSLRTIRLRGLAVFIASLISTTAQAQWPTLPQEPIPKDIQQAISKVMTTHYSANYDTVRGCSFFHGKQVFNSDGEEYGSESNYCLTPISYDIQDINGQSRMYLLVSGYVYDGNTSRADPGLGGLFELYKMGNSWVLSARQPYIYTGGSGRSQLDQFELRQVGANKYGWIGKHCGSGAGGQSNCLWQMYAPMGDGTIKLVADIDLDYYAEIMSEDKYYKGEGSITPDYNAKMSGGFYPLNVTMLNTSGPVGSDSNCGGSSQRSAACDAGTVEETTYTYNPAKKQFEPVKSRKWG